MRVSFPGSDQSVIQSPCASKYEGIRKGQDMIASRTANAIESGLLRDKAEQTPFLGLYVWL